jgi:hypothetical protein
MPVSEGRPGLAAIDEAIAAGDIEAARQAVFELDDEEQAILATEIGVDGLRRTFREARRGPRGPRLGRVLVLPGLMGTQLDSVDASGDSDRVWFNPFRILTGRIRDLQLDAAGVPLPPPHSIAKRALFPHVYLPLLLHLGTKWDVRPFGFDWRIDVARSAAELADEVRSWANGEPAHLVAHSMGGLVSRRFIRDFPEVWASMQDPTGRGRGGRLVMMGTPNRGSFAITLALSGEEQVVKTIEKIDLDHDMGELLRILNTFPASYQHMPSPLADLGPNEDHLKLFDAASWGALPVQQGLIDRGKRFQEEMHRVIDAERLVYVAGFNVDTPYRIHIPAPGVFRYDTTPNGDGRVPLILGMLDGVATFWVAEKHGDLPKNPQVIAGIDELLLTGTTTALDDRRSPRRASRAATRPYEPAVDERVPEEVPALVAELRARRSAGRPTLDQELAAARLEALALADYLGTPPPFARGDVAAARAAKGRSAVPAGRAAAPPLRVDVVWGDITQAEGDVFAVGHYQGVMPQNAELALDRAISAGGLDANHLVLTEHSRRGLLRGELGDVEFFPWNPGRLVAVAGMGHLGSFGESQLRRLARNLAWSVASLPKPRTICTVLIGAGEGNLSVEAAVAATFRGLADALLDPSIKSRIGRLRIVELYRGRAQDILAALLALRGDAQVADGIALHVEPKVLRGEGGGVSREEGLGLFIDTAARGMAGRTAGTRRALTALLAELPREKGLKQQVSRTLGELGRGAGRVRIRLGDAAQATAIPTRISFVRDAGAIRAAAITDTATVAERSLTLDPKLVDELVVRTTDPDPAALDSLSSLVRRLLFPRDFGGLIQRGRPFVFELDRSMARVHWELTSSDEGGGGPAPLGRSAQVARQLRTAYSPPPAPEARPGRATRALVVGDPGDPAKGESLPGARREARRVAEILRERGLDVVEMIGAPGGAQEGAQPASRIDVLDRLMEGRFDILHYSGHGDFDPVSPDRAGWVFKDGLLTSRELERMDLAPRLVVANACLSGLTSTVAGSRPGAPATDADLLPSLADEFFRRGVRDYIGTAWEVSDSGAVLFAEVLYAALLGDPPRTLGEAMLEARQRLAGQDRLYGALWAAYQHYGDPTAYVAERASAAAATAPASTRSARSRAPASARRGRSARSGSGSGRKTRRRLS